MKRSLHSQWRLTIIAGCTLCLYFAVGLFLPVASDVATDVYYMPGLTVMHWHGSLRFEIIDVKPLVLVVSLAISFLLTWSLFWLASRYGKRKPH